jgi:septum site-determining protein MinC
MSAEISEKNIINLSNLTTPKEVLNEIVELTSNFSNTKITLKLGSIDLSEAHISSIKSILENFNISLEIIHTDSIETQKAALAVGLAVLSNSETKKENSFSEKQPSKSGQSFYLKQTLRSGQTIEFDGNVVIIGDCNPGSEIIATGDVVIWGILGGIAHAGASGNRKTSIKALKINAIQLRIADLIARRPDRLKMSKMERKDTYVPEEAKIENDEIIIYSLNG